MALKEDYKDAVFAGLRKYKMLDNGDGTVSPVDMTEYEAAGDKFGAKDVNAITKMVNCTGDAFDPGRDYEVGDYTIYDNTVWKFTTAHPAGEWDESHVEKTRILVEIAEQNKNFAELNEKLTVVEVDMTSAKLNTDVLASYPAGFYRKNCVIIGISVYDRVNNNYYSLFGDTTVTAMLGSKVIVKTSQSNYIGAGSKIRVVLYKIA